MKMVWHKPRKDYVLSVTESKALSKKLEKMSKKECLEKHLYYDRLAKKYGYTNTYLGRKYLRYAQIYHTWSR